MYKMMNSESQNRSDHARADTRQKRVWSPGPGPLTTLATRTFTTVDREGRQFYKTNPLVQTWTRLRTDKDLAKLNAAIQPYRKKDSE